MSREAFCSFSGATRAHFHRFRQMLSSQSAGVGGLRVEAVDKSVGADVSLAGATMSRKLLSQFASASSWAGRPRLTSRSASQRGNSAHLSDVRYNASAVTSIDVVLRHCSASYR